MTSGSGPGAPDAADGARAIPGRIRVASVADGTGRQVWKSDPGPGSVFRAVVAEDQLVWTGANRIVFPWERDGWTHLYSVPIEGGTATLLTPGEFEVEHVSYSADRQRDRLLLEPGRYRPAPHLAGVELRAGVRPRRHHGRRLRMVAGAVLTGGDRVSCAATRKRPARAVVQFGVGVPPRPGAGNDPGRFPGGRPGRPAAGDLHRHRRHADPRASSSCRPATRRP